jgi:hypothetical protein
MSAEETGDKLPEGQIPAAENSAKVQISVSTGTLKKIGASALVAAIALVGAFAFMSMRSDSRLFDANVNCDVVDASGFTLAEDNQSMTFDGSGNDDYFGGDFSDLICVLDELQAPSTIQSRMEGTNSLMGVQNGEWDGISISWSYHPDNGLDANLEIMQ